MHKSKRYALAGLMTFGIVSPVMASMNVYLNFGSNFESEVDSVNSLLGLPNFTPSQLGTMQSDIQQQLTTLYGDYQITFSLTDSPGARQIQFSPTVSGGTVYGATSAAPFGNYDLTSHDYARIYPQNFVRPLQPPEVTSNFAVYQADYTRFLTNVAGHELGHSLGLQHWYSYGVPQITPWNYASTVNPYNGREYQSYNVIADLKSGKNDIDELSSLTTIGAWDRAVFDITGGTAEGGASIVNHPVLEVAGSAGHTLAAATPLAFTTGETSGLQLSLRRATLDASGTDFYQFTTSSAGLFTAQALSGSGVAFELGQAFHPKITLLASDGVTPIWSTDGVSYAGDNYETPVPSNSNPVSIGDPFLNNIPLPSAGTYFVKVEAEGSFSVGNLYQLLSGFNAGYIPPDTFVYQNTGGGSWSSSAAWKTPPAGSLSDFPSSDKTAIAIIGSGGLAPAVVSNSTVQFNQTYDTSAGIDEVLIDSGNTLVQSSSTSVMVTNKIALGMYGAGTYIQSSGSNNVGHSIALGLSPGTGGTYNLSGDAEILTPGSEYIGYNGNGTFTQTGGTNTLYNNLWIAANPGSSGTYNLQGGTLALITDFTDGIFLNANGTFHQTGGTLIFPAFTQNGGTALFDNGLDLNAATYSLNGGSLTIPSDQNLTIENTAGTVFKLNSATATLTVGGLDTKSNPANFVWNAGTLQTTRAPLDFVSFPDPFGSNPLSNAQLTLDSQKHLIVSDLEWLGDDGGSITQTTGSTNTCLSLYIGSAGGSATYNLNGGTLTSTLLEIVGLVIPIGETNYGGPGSFTQTGGTNNANSFNVGYNAAGTYSMSGGTLIASTTYNGGTITQTGGISSLCALSGPGVLIVGGGSGPASTTVTQFAQGTISVSDNGVFSVQPNSHFDNSVSALTITGTGQLDLSNNRMFIDYGADADPKASVAAWISSGFAGGSWNGAGIISITARADSAHYGLGYSDSADAGNPAGLDASGQIEITFALLGDGNLDGKVNALDFNALATNFGKTDQFWSDGDFNYDGTVNTSDFTALAGNFNATSLSAPAPGSLVPEPTAIAVAAALAALSQRRRIRSSNPTNQLQP